MGHRHDRGTHAHGGALMGDARRYERLTGRLLRGFYRGVATDIARVAPSGARVLEVGCGPGHLAIDLAFRHGVDVVGLDLDPAMIERARAATDTRAGGDGPPPPTFRVGDAAALPFPDESFDLVVSTLSLHHWADHATGLAEIARVLSPAGRALIWDLGAGSHLLHRHVPDLFASLDDSRLTMASSTPWHWPWRFTPTTRFELTRPST